MTTIEEVVKMWDKTHTNMQTEVQKGTNVVEGTNGKIKSGSMHKRPDKEAVIRLSNNPAHKFEPWGKRTCYVFSFRFNGQTGKPISIEISFQRRIKEHSNTKAFYDFLNKEFNGEEINDKDINGNKLVLSEGKINHNHLVLKLDFSLDSTEQDICNGMEKFIELTQKKICGFLEGKIK